MKKSYEMDMCNGPLLGKILVFTFPLMLSGVLQLLFNAADIVVVGRFSGAHALAAVGSTRCTDQSSDQCIHGPFYRHQRADSPGVRSQKCGRCQRYRTYVHSFKPGERHNSHRGRDSVFKTPAGAYGYPGGSPGTGGSLYEDLLHRNAGHDGLQLWRGYFKSHRRYQAPTLLSFDFRCGERDSEPDLCDHFQDGSGRSGDSHCDFPGHFRGHGLKMPDGPGWHVPPGSPQAGHPQG